MALIDARRIEVGQVGNLLGNIQIVTTDNLSAATAAGWLNRQGNVVKQLGISPMDKIELVYSYNKVTRTGTYVVAFPSISNGIITLDTGAADNIPLASGRIWVGDSNGLQAPVQMSGDVAIDNAGATTIQAGAVELGMLAAGIAPSHVIRFADQHTTVGGGAGEAITVTGAAATDLAFVQMVDDGTNNVTIVNAVVTADTLTVTFSGDPGNDAVINYQLINAAS